MLCEECKKNEATILLSLVINGRNTQKHFCNECMEKLKMSFVKGDIQSLHAALFSALITAKEEKEKYQCTRCGMTYKEFKDAMKLGCAQCYQDFEEPLKPILLRIHVNSQHRGRIPFMSREEQERMDTISALRSRLDEAVRDENFEDAAVYRDQLKELTKEGGGI